MALQLDYVLELTPPAQLERTAGYLKGQPRS